MTATTAPATTVAGLMTPGISWEEAQELAAEHAEKNWYAIYTKAKHEKRVAEQLETRELEHFLPTCSSVRRWKDRRVTLQLPLFPGYVFLRLALCDRLRAVQIPGVVRLVGFNGTPAPLPSQEIEALRVSIANGESAKPHRFLTVGRRVRVNNGPLAGLEGILIERKNGPRVVISIKLIQRSFAVEYQESDLDLLQPSARHQGMNDEACRSRQTKQEKDCTL